MKLFFLTILLINIGNIRSVKANLFTEKFVTQTITASPKSASNNNNNLLAMFLLGGVGFALGVNSPFFIFRRASTTAEKELPSDIKSENTIEMSDNKKDSYSYIVYVEKAYNNFGQGNIEGALKNFKDAIRSQPNNAKIYSERAYFRKNKLGDKEGAIADYTQAIDINPDNPLFYFCRSQTYLELGDRHKAIKDYNTAMDIAPEDIMYNSGSDSKLKSMKN
jgi:tetratricopeptide (TPR) repeat protein